MKKIAIAALAAGISLCTGFGATALTASAETLADHADGIKMNVGASVRYLDAATESSSVNPEDNGLRFELLISTDAYTAAQTIGGNATFGVLIAPAEYEKTAPLTQEYVFGDKKAYDWATWSEEKQQYEYTETDNDNDGESDYTRIINVSTTVDFTNTNLKTTTIKETVDGTETDVTYYHYYGSITGIREENLAREFIGVGYVQAGDDTQFAVRNDNVRSIAYVAQMAIADTASDAPSPTAKTWLETNYVTPVLDEETTYTVEYRVGTNVSGGETVIKSKPIKATIGSKIELGTPTLDGYNCVAAEDNATTVLANGKTTVVVDCTYANPLKVELQSDSSQYYNYDGGVMFYLTKDTSSTFGAVSGIFYNTTSEEHTVSVGGGYGDAVIVDKNGIVVEGRDGQNNKLVNAENPTRAGSTTTIATGATGFAQNMQVPAGGFAIVVQQSSNYLSYGVTTEDNIRSFMHNKIISNYGNCVQISLTENTAFTTYQNAAPIVSTPETISLNVKYNGTFDNQTLLENITVTDDNGTFETSDNNGDKVTMAVKSANVKWNTAGTYNCTLTATDENGAITEFTRSVVVNDEITVTIGTTEIKMASGAQAQFSVDQKHQGGQSGFQSIAMRLHTSASTLNISTTSDGNTTGYTAAIVINKNTKCVVKSYGALGTAYTEKGEETIANHTSSFYNALVDYQTNYGDGDYYLLIMPNGNATVDANDTSSPQKTVRQSLHGIASTAVGQKVTISYYDF